MKHIRKAVIPAAGFGTRFLPATKAMPKEMLPIVDKPTIQYIVEEILASGIDEILIISGHAKRAIEDHFDSSPELESHLYEHGKMELLKEIQKISNITVHYIRQKHMNGLGDAILCAKTFVDDEPFAVILGDDVVYHEGEPALAQLIDVYRQTGATVLGCQEVAPEAVSSYGIVKGIPHGQCPHHEGGGYGGKARRVRGAEPHGRAGAVRHHTGRLFHSGGNEARQGRRGAAHGRAPRDGSQ